MPYAYDVVMYRHLEDGDLDPRTMINTKVAIYMRGKAEDYTVRRGVFQTFEKDGTNKRTFDQGKANRLHGLQGTDYSYIQDVGLRNKVSCVREHVGPGYHKGGGLRVSVSTQVYASYFVMPKDDDSKFPKIPYCVQFGESSMNFLHRLMAEFNIWYYFDHGDLEMQVHEGNGIRMVVDCRREDDPRDRPCVADQLLVSGHGNCLPGTGRQGHPRSRRSTDHDLSA